ncbi:MAG: glycosyltransferase family 4 protein [Gloeobacterales cyanobacterium]
MIDNFTYRPNTIQTSTSGRALRKQKILISSYRFHPSVGGIETVALIVAEELAKQGYTIKVITQTPADQNHLTDFPFDIIRRPSPLQTLDLVRWCDLFLINNNNSLRAAWPLLAMHKPAIVVHHGQYVPSEGLLAWQEPLKHHVHHRVEHISVSYALAKQLDTLCTVVANPYRDDLFFEKPELERNHELVFLGRLDHQKGLDLLFKALKLLQEEALTPCLTVIGSGIEEKNFRRLAQDLGIASQVHFVGEKTGLELVHLLNAHQIMVVPSRPFEAFGVVALEGIACGCVVLGSAQGGLPEAIGPCGETFIPEDVEDLAKQLSNLLRHPERLSVYRANAKEYLPHFRRDRIASSYLAVVERVLNSVV